MNETIRVIKSRRSIRRFKPDATVALGYKDESPPPKPRRKDVINYVK